MSEVLTDSSGNTDVTITIRGTDKISFTLYGDSIAEQYSTKIVVDGNELANDWQDFVGLARRQTAIQ